MARKPKSRSDIDISDCAGKQQADDDDVGNGVGFQEEDVEVDIEGCVNQRDDEFQEEGEEEGLSEASSSSSSFGDSMCSRDADDSGFGDGDEAQSILSKDYPLRDGTEGLNKKKTDDRWQRLTKAIQWRSTWIELKVKEFVSQARVYDKVLQDCGLTKQFNLEKAKLEGFYGKSIPFREHSQSRSVFKRGRRKRVEETTDVAAYMSNHNLFSYADKRVPVNVKAQYLEPDLGTGRKATGKQDGTEDDCLLSELDCSDDLLAKLMCKIDEAQGKARGLRKRVDQLMWDSQIPQTTDPCHQDFTVQNGKECAIVEDPLTRNQREASVQCISADHTEHLLVPQTPPTQIGGQCLTNNSPISSKSLRFHPILEDLLMDDKEMNDDDFEADDEKLDYFRKLINEITGVVSPDEAKPEEDPTPATKRRKTSH
ncbi:hypothetical protein CARUB_v10017197mg [Capsella rubella]|uniref:Uncharacterized protein n=2 Tax=Capsella rubella TaxID=81985 RepID=R0FND7_9BRAS|nr:uncharacterized protein LOC17887157 [Capsella rubella]XP_006291080.2 uncharacterized protein LOC17887157 [Capsella rubella]XP_006291081.1 uncharacterized protein LOC17887157 [Capsella rubella]XP_023638818.1 uncharacterized protein LOC17887157 [Capsella rubella]EOA23977.1 hypothetical protein CARUB_v10017197mg [Capsella rubella]EOA23979.1 hypothetical protein CARUB_v10017197mg [Capsella rubella]